jgi:hypothetical protein
MPGFKGEKEQNIYMAMAEYLKRKKIPKYLINAYERAPLHPGTIVRHIETGGHGIITEHAKDNLYEYCYAEFYYKGTFTKMSMDSPITVEKIEILGGSAWHEHSEFEIIAEPDAMTRALLHYYFESGQDN